MKKENQARKNGKGPSPETQAQTAENPVKKIGHPTAENEWFNIGLSPVEVAMLKNIQARIFINPMGTTRAQTIRLLILGALAHYDTLGAVLFGDAEYLQNEGFECSEDFFEKMIQKRVDGSGADLDAIRERCASRRPAGKSGRAQSKREAKQDAVPTQTALPKGWQISGLLDMEDELYAVAGLMKLFSSELADHQSDQLSENTKHAATGTVILADWAMTKLWAAFRAAWDYYKALPEPGAGAGAASTEAGKGGAK